MDVTVVIAGAGPAVRNDGAEIVVLWWSFTKTLIAAAVLALARDGALRLDDRLPGRPYTLRLLLQHRAGLADYGSLKRYHDAVARDEDRPWRTTAYGLGVMTGSGPEDSRVIGHSGDGPGSVIAVYHHPDATPPFTAAAFSSGEDVGRVEAEAMALRNAG